MRRLVAVVLLCGIALSVRAGEARDLADDPVTEQRMVRLAEKLRCLVCQNESLASSKAELAEDLRREVREQIRAGKSDGEITDYLVSRYGDFVLYDPPFRPYTLVLWLGPFVLLLLAGAGLVHQVRRHRRTVAAPALSAEAERRAAALLQQDRETHGR